MRSTAKQIMALWWLVGGGGEKTNNLTRPTRASFVLITKNRCLDCVTAYSNAKMDYFIDREMEGTEMMQDTQSMKQNGIGIFAVWSKQVSHHPKEQIPGNYICIYANLLFFFLLTFSSRFCVCVCVSWPIMGWVCGVAKSGGRINNLWTTCGVCLEDRTLIGSNQLLPNTICVCVCVCVFRRRGWERPLREGPDESSPLSWATAQLKELTLEVTHTPSSVAKKK